MTFHMKKFIVIVAALLLGFQAKAQIIADAGFVMSFEKTTNVDGIKFPSTLFGVYAGANYYYSLDNFMDGLAILPGANFSVLMGRHWHWATVKVSEIALNIPVQASFTHEINEKVKVFGQTGPTFQLALSYKAKSPGSSFPLLKKNNDFYLINDGHPEARNPFNIFWGFAAGAEIIDMLRIELGVDFGFFNLNRKLDHSDVNKITRTTLHVGVGYLF